MIVISLLFIVCITSFSLVSLSYADSTWQKVKIDSPFDDNTKYIFYYNSEGVELLYVLYSDNTQPILLFNTTQITDTQLQIKVPKNYPVESPEHGWIAKFDELKWDYYEYKERNCFFNYIIPISNSTILEFETLSTIYFNAYYLSNSSKYEAEFNNIVLDEYCFPYTEVYDSHSGFKTIMHDMQCNPKHVLVLRSNDAPACVYGGTASRFDWMVIATEFVNDTFDTLAPKSGTFDPSLFDPSPKFASFMDGNDPNEFVYMYNHSPGFKLWFDLYYEDMTIRQAVGLDEPNKVQTNRDYVRRS